MLRILAVLGAAMMLVGCTTGYGGKIDPQLVRNFRLERVDVAVAPDVTFWWGDGERAYARSIGRDTFDAAALGETPEGRAFMGQLAASRIKMAFDRELTGRLLGDRPVRLEVVMTAVNVSSPVQRVLIGGGYFMKASARLIDAKTGNVIAVNPDLRTSAQAGNGVLGTMIDPAFGDPVDRLSTNLAQSYRNWLLNS